jgi:hypothetical protein
LGAADVAAGHPLFRARVIEVEAGVHVLAVTIHHLVYDGLSFPVLWRDLSELYAARLAGRPADLPPLWRSYADYAEWQRDSWPALAARALPFWTAVVDGSPRTD